MRENNHPKTKSTPAVTSPSIMREDVGILAMIRMLNAICISSANEAEYS